MFEPCSVKSLLSRKNDKKIVDHYNAEESSEPEGKRYSDNVAIQNAVDSRELLKEVDSTLENLRQWEKSRKEKLAREEADLQEKISGVQTHENESLSKFDDEDYDEFLEKEFERKKQQIQNDLEFRQQYNKVDLLKAMKQPQVEDTHIDSSDQKLMDKVDNNDQQMRLRRLKEEIESLKTGRGEGSDIAITLQGGESARSETDDMLKEISSLNFNIEEWSSSVDNLLLNSHIKNQTPTISSSSGNPQMSDGEDNKGNPQESENIDTTKSDKILQQVHDIDKELEELDDLINSVTVLGTPSQES